MNLKKVFISFGFSCVLAGCATTNIYENKHSFNTTADLPANSGFSEAKQFAQAMGLTLMDDDGDNYKLFAAYGAKKYGHYRTKLKEPVSIQDVNKQIEMGEGHTINLANAGLGMINPFLGLLALDTRSQEEKFIPYESQMFIGHWDDKPYSIGELRLTIKPLEAEYDKFFRPYVIEAIQSGEEQMDCSEPRMLYHALTSKEELVGVDFVSSKKPPFHHKLYFTRVQFDDCHLMVYQRSEGKLLPKFVEISKLLGNDYAIFLPATLKSEPVILHDGEVLKFRK